MQHLTQVLADHNVDMRALSLAETSDFGIVRIIVDDVYAASTMLKEEGFIHNITKVLGVATFYSQFRFQAVGKYLIMVCKGTACYVNGADRIAEAVKEELGIGDNETTADGLFSLSLVSCLGCCSLAPVMMINEDTYGSLTPDKVKKILRDIREKEGK